jgi:Ca2+-binding RTX toxin-like protein
MSMRRTTIGMALLAMSAWLVTGSASGTHLTTEQCQNQHVTILGDDQPSTGVEFLNGTSGSDVILANGGGLDIVDGKDGEDYLCGNEGVDSIEGGGAGDHINGGSDDDDILGGGGNDEIDGGADADDIHAGDGNDGDVHGDAQQDIIRGDTGDDDLSGDEHNDTIFGNAGTDDTARGGGHGADPPGDACTAEHEFTCESNA